ncbi:hypothetical protein EIP91_000851 [Steccherinum ochraceum]|uniref:Uncharacterized protein n=1 Tax=Steccherinum ochraceum TaxID=92696 RepID=A0A4R0RVZ1_9APHY|nr:hypothetical protein EIP91_000851 [Steccherinum ochraceum]
MPSTCPAHFPGIDHVHSDTSLKSETSPRGESRSSDSIHSSETDDESDDDFEFVRLYVIRLHSSVLKDASLLSQPDDFEGFDILPKFYRPSKRNPYPDLLHLILPVTEQSLLKFINRLHGDVSLEDLGLKKRSMFLARYIVRHLSEQRQFKIQYLAVASGVPQEADAYIHICSNYSVEERGGEEKAKRVGEWVKEQLELDEEIKPKWYFGIEPETPSMYRQNSLQTSYLFKSVQAAVFHAVFEWLTTRFRGATRNLRSSIPQHLVTGRVTSLAVESQERRVDEGMQDNKQPEGVRERQTSTHDNDIDSPIDRTTPTSSSAHKSRTADVRKVYCDPKFVCEANPHGLDLLGPLADGSPNHDSEEEDSDDGFEFPEPFEGFDILPKFYLPSKKHRRPDLLHLVLPVTDQCLSEFVSRLHGGHIPPDVTDDWWGLDPYVTEHLSTQSNFKIQFSLSATGVPHLADGFIHLCSNYSVEKKGEEEAKRVGEWVKEQLRLAEEVKPRWFFDLEPSTPSRYKKNTSTSSSTPIPGPFIIWLSMNNFNVLPLTSALPHSPENNSQFDLGRNTSKTYFPKSEDNDCASSNDDSDSSEETDQELDEYYENPNSFEGFVNLPKRFLPTKKYPRPDLLHFALPVTRQCLLDFISRLHEGVSLEQLGIEDDDAWDLAIYVTRHLSRERHFKIQYLSAASDLPCDADALIHLCSNYSIEMKGEEEVKQVGEWVKEQLGLAKELKPKWFFDTDPDTPSRHRKASVWQQRTVW